MINQWHQNCFLNFTDEIIETEGIFSSHTLKELECSDLKQFFWPDNICFWAYLLLEQTMFSGLIIHYVDRNMEVMLLGADIELHV